MFVVISTLSECASGDPFTKYSVLVVTPTLSVVCVSGDPYIECRVC